MEIQDAVAELREEEKQALAVWLASQTPPEMGAEDERKLLRTLDEAVRDVEVGKGVPMNEVRKRVASWAAK